MWFGKNIDEGCGSWKEGTTNTEVRAQNIEDTLSMKKGGGGRDW